MAPKLLQILLSKAGGDGGSVGMGVLQEDLAVRGILQEGFPVLAVNTQRQLDGDVVKPARLDLLVELVEGLS